MPLTPAALEKTWLFAENRVVPATGTPATTYANGHINVKAALKGLTAAPCGVAGSSNGTVAGLDGIDRVASASDLVNAVGAHSWWVLTWPQLGMEVCWDFSTGNAGQAVVIASLDGFTGGSTTARPTATDEQVLRTGSLGGSNGDVQKVVHVLHADDGTLSHVFICEAGQVVDHWIFAEASSPVSGWTTTALGAVWHGGPVTVSSYYSAGAFKGWHGSALMNLEHAGLAIYPNTKGGAAQPIVTFMEVPDGISNEWHFAPMSLYGSSAGARGRHGRIADLWAAPQGISKGTRFPSDTAEGFAVVLDDTLVPWSGAPAQMA